jgi:hypothetical protein
MSSPPISPRLTNVRSGRGGLVLVLVCFLRIRALDLGVGLLCDVFGDVFVRRSQASFSPVVSVQPHPSLLLTHLSHLAWCKTNTLRSLRLDGRGRLPETHLTRALFRRSCTAPLPLEEACQRQEGDPLQGRHAQCSGGGFQEVRPLPSLFCLHFCVLPLQNAFLQIVTEAARSSRNPQLRRLAGPDPMTEWLFDFFDKKYVAWCTCFSSFPMLTPVRHSLTHAVILLHMLAHALSLSLSLSLSL